MARYDLPYDELMSARVSREVANGVNVYLLGGLEKANTSGVVNTDQTQSTPDWEDAKLLEAGLTIGF
jgi:hypothetical protein